MRPEAIDRLEQTGMMDSDNEYVKKQSQFKEVAKRLAQNKVAVAGLIIVIIFVLIAIFAPLLAPYSPTAFVLKEKNQSPSLTHLLGTDDMGRDILSRLIYGARYS
ncbi:MAG: hypothetical protein LUF30_10250, partial [Lachnospiraceae bacterium]|nr:hypothetical protein [Lachnospiraceae bacterium]